MNVQGNGQTQARGIGLVTCAAPIPYDTNQRQPNEMVAAPSLHQPRQAVAASTLYQPSQVVGTAAPDAGSGFLSASEYAGASHRLAFHQARHQQPQSIEHQLQAFWANQLKEVEKAEFRNHGLPLARIKKIMKSDEDVRMISAEAPVIFAKACEMFISELTLRSWYVAEVNKRRTLQKNDIATATARADIFDFLVDIVPREDPKDNFLGSLHRLTMPVTGASDAFTYHVLPKHEHQVCTSATMGKSALQVWPPQGSDKPEPSQNAQE